MSLLKNILQLIQEEMDKKNMMIQNGDLPLPEKEEELIEKSAVETPKNDHEYLLNKIEELENRLKGAERLNEIITKNIVQFDKNLKTVNEDFSVLAGAVSQLFQFFSQLKIIQIPTDDVEATESTDTNDPDPVEIDDFDLDNLENITDWEAFKEKHKKKFQ